MNNRIVALRLYAQNVLRGRLIVLCKGWLTFDLKIAYTTYWCKKKGRAN